jgi:hypothetical protein
MSIAIVLAGQAKPAVRHGLDWSAIIARVGVPLGAAASVATIITVVPIFRDAVRRAWRAVLMRVGVPHYRYARRFTEIWGTYRNPYLNREEQLDLRNTYVPLSFQVQGAQQVQWASDVLTALPRRLVIVGNPGSGKSTLLAAYGVGALGHRHIVGRRKRVVPYLIQLRDFATFLEPGQAREPGANLIVDYLIREILIKGKFFKSAAQAAEFLKNTLDAGCAVLMLDGLDEVPDDRLYALLGALDDFMTDGSDEHPTERARILMTCRTQNFHMVRTGWIDASFAPYNLYALAPLRDSDIMVYLQRFGYQQKFSYLRKPPVTFTTAEGPERFLDAIRIGNKIDLLRVPLILAMAVGLYAEHPEDIPSTIGELYEKMIEEMLDRHSFIHDRPGTGRSLNHYKKREKYSLLRQFALYAARETDNFGDFTKGSLLQYAESLADSLDMGGKPEAFVEEIMKHSGLLSDAGQGELWHYAHRSLQEFLAAQELRLDTDDGFLLGTVRDLGWRQVTLFYTVGREARQVDGFLLELAKRNPELAVRCLQGARPSVAAAEAVLDTLRLTSRDSVAALAAATHSPRPAIQERAVARLKAAILAPDGLFSATSVGAASVGTDEMLPLLESLASTNAADIVAVLPPVLSRLPDDPRLVAPLWKCLSADGVEGHRDECKDIVGRLLALVTDEDAFARLAGQDRRDRGFLTEARKSAYPFRNALDPGHNMVTLLAWAEYLQLLPAHLNEFFAAKAAGKLGTVEDDKRRTISVSLCWPARICSALLLIGSIIATIVVLDTHPGLALHPFGGWTVALIVGVGLAPYALFFVLSEEVFPDAGDEAWYGYSRVGSGFALFTLMGSDPRIKNFFDSGFGTFATLGITWSAFAIAPIALATSSLVAYLALSLGAQVLYWATGLNLFNSSRHYYLYRPNEYVDMYEDPKSRHWIIKPKQHSGH